jgi:hypothetical protein
MMEKVNCFFGPYKMGPHRSRPKNWITLGLCSRVYRICAMWRRFIKSIVVILSLWYDLSFVIACIIHYEVVSCKYHITQLLLDFNSLCFKRCVYVCVCERDAFFHKRCLWSQHTFHNKSIINPRWWLVLIGWYESRES